jgi:hypothetical protein
MAGDFRLVERDAGKGGPPLRLRMTPQWRSPQGRTLCAVMLSSVEAYQNGAAG